MLFTLKAHVAPISLAVVLTITSLAPAQQRSSNPHKLSKQQKVPVTF